MDLAVTPGDAISRPYFSSEVYVRNDPVCRVETPNVHLGGGRQ
jgi:hypothetical protein